MKSRHGSLGVRKKVIIVYGGPSREYEVSLETAKSVLQHIDTKKYDPTPLHISRRGLVEPDQYNNWSHQHISFDKMLTELVELYDCACICMHGEYGEDGTIQRLFERNGIPYTGSNAVASRLCMNKCRSGEIVGKLSGIESIPTKRIKTNDEVWYEGYDNFPAIIKPNDLGSSVGVYRVENQQDIKDAVRNLKKLRMIEFLVQPCIVDAVEVSCGCLQRGDGSYMKLQPVEIEPKGSDFYDYRAKYKKDRSNHHIPPKSLSQDIADTISELACSIHGVLGCSGYSRSDFLVKDKVIYYLETNTLPGMTATSLLPEEAKHAGIGFRELISFIIEAAII